MAISLLASNRQMDNAGYLYSSLELLAILFMPLSLVLLANRSLWTAFCTVQLICLVAILIFSFLRTRSVLLYHMWIMGYIFIIWSEMYIVARNPLRQEGYLEPFFLFTISNSLVLLSYRFRHARWKVKKAYSLVTSDQRKRMFWVLLIVSIVAIIVLIPGAINTYLYGRGHSSTPGSSAVIKGFWKSIGMVLPAIVAYYYCHYTKHPWRSLWLAIPLMAITILGSTRYKMLYSVIGYMFVMISPKNFKIKYIVVFLVGAFVLIAWSSYVRNNRMQSAEDRETFQLFENNRNSSKKSIADYMSPEGVVSMAVYADMYFSQNQLHWGKESAFLLYFWVPRIIWPDKPKQLSYWLIREFETVAKKHSTASGYIGELRADFGWGSLFFMLLFGLFLKEGDFFVSQVNNSNYDSFNRIIASLLYPTVFFIVRSPQTAIPAFLGMLVVILILRKLLTTKSRI